MFNMAQAFITVKIEFANKRGPGGLLGVKTVPYICPAVS
jgi:hypothetical protein